jgi:hypothetical protein
MLLMSLITEHLKHMDSQQSVFHVLAWCLLYAVAFVVRSCEKLIMVHSYCKEICAFTIVAVPLLSFLKNYLPKKFKLHETGDLIEQLNYYHTFIKKTKYFYKKLAQRL